MKRRILYITIVTIGIVFCGCFESWDRWLEGEPQLETEIQKKARCWSPHFNSRDYHIAIDSVYDKQLGVHVAFNIPDRVKMTRDSSRVDDNHEVNLLLEFYNEDSVIYTNRFFVHSNWGYRCIYPEEQVIYYHKNDSMSSFGNLDSMRYIHPMTRCFPNGEEEKFYTYEYSGLIPYYIFHELGAGEQSIKMKLSAFTSELIPDTFYNQLITSNEVDVMFFESEVIFDLNIPEIIESKFVLDTLLVKDDDTFDPHTMDFALFGPGLPDLYWEMEYAGGAFNWNDRYPYQNSIYYQSSIYRNETSFPVKDTLTLYHYSEMDSIRINIWDRDVLSRDDYMGHWEGSVNDLKNNPAMEIGDIKEFSLIKLNP